jgi:hypothetical protein
MGRKTAGNIIAILFFIFLMQAAASAAEKAPERKVYHNEKWDILLLYPPDWTYVENFDDNIPVRLKPPEKEEPDGFVWAYFVGEKVFKNLDEFEKKFLSTQENVKVVSRKEAETKEGYKALDFRLSFTDDDDRKFLSDYRLTIAAKDYCWILLYERPADAPEAVENEALEIMHSLIFEAAKYLNPKEKS